jgi:hypothetical protein
MVYRFDRQPAEGFITTPTFGAGQSIELMSPEGYLEALEYREVKAVCFVAEGGDGLLFREETAFGRRPKLPGLWARFELRDGDAIEGVLPHNLAEWPEAGFLIIPPKSGSQRQKVFLPRLAVRATDLRGIIGKAPDIGKAGRKTTKPHLSFEEQLRMFE